MELVLGRTLCLGIEVWSHPAGGESLNYGNEGAHGECVCMCVCVCACMCMRDVGKDK